VPTPPLSRSSDPQRSGVGVVPPGVCVHNMFITIKEEDMASQKHVCWNPEITQLLVLVTLRVLVCIWFYAIKTL
jgi:hypothetical protein